MSSFMVSMSFDLKITKIINWKIRKIKKMISTTDLKFDVLSVNVVSVMLMAFSIA
jgi:hypothetical protein